MITYYKVKQHEEDDPHNRLEEYALTIDEVIDLLPSWCEPVLRDPEFVSLSYTAGLHQCEVKIDYHYTYRIKDDLVEESDPVPDLLTPLDYEIEDLPF